MSSTDEDVDALRPVSITDGVVTRPAGAWSATVHEFLRYLRGEGLTCVPEPISIDGDVERLVAIEGDSGGDGWAHQHSDAGLGSAARLLRTIHDAAAGWSPPADAVFRAPAVESDAESVWCHGDVGPWNMVWQGDEAVGLIDWDFLHRGPRMDDVAYALRWFAPARDDANALDWHHFPVVPDRAHRVQVFLDTYGALPRFVVAETIAARIEVTMAHELSLAQAGVEPQRTWVSEGSQGWAAGEARWVREHAHLLTPEPELLSAKEIAEDPRELVRRGGTVVAEFGAATQDSGNVSWLVDTPRGRYFVKTAGPTDDRAPASFLAHTERVRLLRNAVDLAASCRHAALPRLRNVIESPYGPALVYDAATGQLVHVPAAQRGDPASAYQRFAQLPAGELLPLLDTLIDLHRDLAGEGWIACDLYDGALIVDFDRSRLSVIDLDSYRRGPGVNEMGRAFGADRFMAPEEYRLGAVIDERTTVFTLGRLAWHFGTRLTEEAEHFCGPSDLAGVVQRACRTSPDERYPSVAAFADAWESARRADA